MRRICNVKVLIPAPETVTQCNRFMGGVDKHNKLHSTFSLGKWCKLKKILCKTLTIPSRHNTNEPLVVLQTSEWGKVTEIWRIKSRLLHPLPKQWCVKIQIGKENINQTRSNDGDSDDFNVHLPSRNVNCAEIITSVNTDACQPCAFSVAPFHLSKTGKFWNWKG
jgi:hypothetical protein